MNKIFAAALLCCFAAPSAFALDAKIQGAIDTFDKTVQDPAKLKAYCAMSKKMDEIGDDDKKAEAAGDEIDGYFKILGPDFEAANAVGDDVKEGTPEAKAFEDAMTKIDGTCPQ